MKASFELINFPPVDNTAKAFGLPRPMALHKNIFIWLDVGNVTSWKVTGSIPDGVTGIFR